jgi:hypothetical protein
VRRPNPSATGGARLPDYLYSNFGKFANHIWQQGKFTDSHRDTWSPPTNYSPDLCPIS